MHAKRFIARIPPASTSPSSWTATAAGPPATAAPPAGHRAGAQGVRRVVEAAPRVGVGTLTLYAFSADNWKRPALEVRR